jgi:two-component system, LytTR family, response regulator
MRTKCLIVDDEPLAIEVIQSHVEKIESLEVISSCRNAMEAFDILNKEQIDLLFLDIQMPGLKGTDFLKNLEHPPKVIITTAYREYALEGYELNVVDYLLKPISFERFFKAIRKYMQLAYNPAISINPKPVENKEEFIYIRINKKVHKIKLSEILFIESVKDYITIHMNAQKITAKHTISSLGELLPKNGFLRIHRSYIVSMEHIKSFTAHNIEIGKLELPIGRNYHQQVFKALNYTPTEG